MKNVNPVGWFDIYVSDMDRAKAFYEEVFQIQLTDLPIEWGRQSLFPSDENGLNIAGGLVEKKDRIPGGSTMVYFVTEDCVTVEARVEKAGGQIVATKMPIGEFGFMSIVVDTEGNAIGLHSRK